MCKKINDYLGSVISKPGGAVIGHPDIRYTDPAMFQGNGVHLSVLQTFLSNLQQGILHVLVSSGTVGSSSEGGGAG